MTANKDFKRLVRLRALRTGESYASARRRLLLRRQGHPLMNEQTLRVEHSEGFSLTLPPNFGQTPPDPDQTHEIARFVSSLDPRQKCQVFRIIDDVPSLDERVAAVHYTLAKSGRFSNFRTSRIGFADRDGVLLEFDRSFDDGTSRPCRQYITHDSDNTTWAVGLIAADPDALASMLPLATSFEIAS